MVFVTVVFLITNTDEIIYTNIESASSEIEYDASTINLITNDYPANTQCEYAVLTEEARLGFFRDHSDWFYQNFGDIDEKYKEKYLNSDLVTKRRDTKEVENFYQEYFDALRKRVNPSVMEKFTDSDWPYVTLYGDEPYEPECNEIFKQVFNPKQ